MFFWSVFLITYKKKVIDSQKRHFGHFWRLITVFLCVFKNTDQNNICVYIVLKDKTEEKKLKKNWLTPKKSIFEF